MASLSETAKKVLMKEGAVPNAYTLRPASKGMEPVFANPGAEADTGFEDLGGPVTSATDPNPYAKVKTKKDTSKSSQAPVPAETMSEDFELSEELESFISSMVEEGYSDEDIALAITENFDLVEESDDDDEVEEKERKKDMMKEHVNALLAGENLSEDFRTKASTIFESAVSTRVKEEVSVLEEAYAKSLDEEVSQNHEQLIEKVDNYLNYVVEQWITENEVAIESGIRTELTEDFISGLRNLFTEHYIDVPEHQMNVLEEMGSKLENTENRLNEEIEKNVGLTKTLNESKQTEILFYALDGLTTTQAAKLRSLAENVTFTSPKEFESKVKTLKESYFTKPVNTRSNLDPVEDADGRTMIAEEHVGPMSKYVNAIGKTNK